jgi:probable rRNA maturation factor
MGDNPLPALDILIEDDGWNAAVPDAEARARTAAAATLTAASIGDAAAISLLLADDETIAALNRDHRGKDGPTNVLSFPAGEMPAIPGQPRPLGDIAMALGVVEREAEAAGITTPAHFTHLIVHASLHLIGYDHETDEDAHRMESLEITVLGGLGVANPYEITDGQAQHGTPEQ